MIKSQYDYGYLIAQLKSVLKERKLTYKDLGKSLGISEAGVKRIFRSSDGKVSTLARICEALDFSFVDLVVSSRAGSAQVTLFPTYKISSFQRISTPTFFSMSW